jgi:hydrogenase maturation protease
MTVIIGVGNADRGDDAVGLSVARQVRHSLAADLGTARGKVTVIALDGDLLALLNVWAAADGDDVYVIDSICSGGTPGAVYRFDASRALDPRFWHHDSHTLSLGDVVELARDLGRVPASLIGYGIEGASFTLGAPLSPEAEVAVQTVTRRLLHELKTT